MLNRWVKMKRELNLKNKKGDKKIG